MVRLALRDVTLGFRGPALLDHVDLTLKAGERVCLLGRNGSGKTSLLRLLHGDLEPDGGEIVRQQGLSVAMLPQEVPRGLSGCVFDEVARGLGARGRRVAQYHEASRRLARDPSPERAAELDRIQHALEVEGGWTMHREVEAVLDRLALEPDAEVTHLSAGVTRRVLLARALVGHPDLLLLDEPTNHLDIETINGIEELLLRYEGTILFVTHDRRFLRRLATRILELDRGRLSSWSCDYSTYLERKEAELIAEERQRAEFDKRLAAEETWLRTGIKARRSRNEGRVRALERLREVRRERRDQPGAVRAQVQETEKSGRLVIEAKQVTFGYGGPPIVADFSTAIMRGDRVGFIGPNGAGKTTLLRLLLGELRPQAGSVRHGTNLDIAYFDQLHRALDETKSVRENVRDGADTVTVNGKTRHVLGYLADFLFTPEQAAAPVARLSGGERNRLLLARLFTQPSNLLVIDEPTNDLDLETLEVLEGLLMEYPGTLLLVSHDREFLNNVVTGTLALEGEGRVGEYAGGYDDYLRQRPAPPPPPAEPAAKAAPPRKPPRAAVPRLTYRQQQELEALPEQIEVLETEVGALHEAMADPAFYRQTPEEIAAAKARVEALEGDIADAYRRWAELDAVRTQRA